MQKTTLPFLRTLDILWIVLLLLIPLLFWILQMQEKATVAVITVENRCIAEISLAQDRSAFSVNGAEGYLFTVSDGAIAIVQAPCDSQICIQSPPIAYAGQSIVCLPGKLIVSIPTADHAPDVILDAERSSPDA